jgi:hypothetical protein
MGTTCNQQNARSKAMKQWLGMPVVGALLLSACVTINVYFPAAEAKAAAREFVEKVIDEAGSKPIKDTSKPIKDGSSGGGMALQLKRFDFDPWALVGIGSAQAQGAPDISIKTPAIQAIQSRMEGRFNSTLRAGFDSGALGFTEDGLVSVRDAGKLELLQSPMTTGIARRCIARSRSPTGIQNGKHRSGTCSPSNGWKALEAAGGINPEAPGNTSNG